MSLRFFDHVYCNVSGCYDQDTDYHGGDLPNTQNIRNIGSLEGCQEMCQLHRDCYTFTYSTWGCFLKGANPQDIRHASGAVSGPKNCPGQYIKD